MAWLLAPVVKRLSVHTVEPTLCRPPGWAAGFRSASAGGLADPVLLLDLFGQQVEKLSSIGIVDENRFLPIAPGRQVLDSSRKFQSQGTCHPGCLTQTN